MHRRLRLCHQSTTVLIIYFHRRKATQVNTYFKIYKQMRLLTRQLFMVIFQWITVQDQHQRPLPLHHLKICRRVTKMWPPVMLHCNWKKFAVAKIKRMKRIMTGAAVKPLKLWSKEDDGQSVDQPASAMLAARWALLLIKQIIDYLKIRNSG